MTTPAPGTSEPPLADRVGDAISREVERRTPWPKAERVRELATEFAPHALQLDGFTPAAIRFAFFEFVREREQAGKGEAKEPRLCYPFSPETCRIPGCSCRADKAADASRTVAPGDEAVREAKAWAERMFDWNSERRCVWFHQIDDHGALTGAGQVIPDPSCVAFGRNHITDALLAFASRFPRPADSRERERESEDNANATATRIVDEGLRRQDWGTERFRRSIADALEEREKLLREMEWDERATPLVGRCRVCEGTKRMGHAPGCRLAFVLGKEKDS